MQMYSSGAVGEEESSGLMTNGRRVLVVVIMNELTCCNSMNFSHCSYLPCCCWLEPVKLYVRCIVNFVLTSKLTKGSLLILNFSRSSLCTVQSTSHISRNSFGVIVGTIC